MTQIGADIPTPFIFFLLGNESLRYFILQGLMRQFVPDRPNWHPICPGKVFRYIYTVRGVLSLDRYPSLMLQKQVHQASLSIFRRPEHWRPALLIHHLGIGPVFQ